MFLFGRFRLPIFTCDRIFSFGEIHFSGVFCPVVLGTLYLHATEITFDYLPPIPSKALAVFLTLSPILSSRMSPELLEPPVIPCWTSPGVGLLLVCDRPLVEGDRDFARALDFARGAGASRGISSDRLA